MQIIINLFIALGLLVADLYELYEVYRSKSAVCLSWLSGAVCSL